LYHVSLYHLLLLFFESYAYLFNFPSDIRLRFVAACFARRFHLDHQSVGRSGTSGATVTKRRLARKLATQTAFRDPDISRAVSHKLRYAARRRGTLDGLAPLHLAESPPPKDTFSRGNEHKSRSRPISSVQFLPFLVLLFRASSRSLIHTRSGLHRVMNVFLGL